uniref:Uncharacterized protein n=1 Tax=Candidatus Kentrum sp. MB TaxID=2138164 RepID=A0A450XDX2_9GAMM|nr:MAG: hypothetical protein BECKMB1821G_GA0114241_102821 [Candidatus Kentron sp. MB]VFK32053.1 MAG: hypothetical protein BECKMB1821I_GA0114274_102920 [Candidatus Kentron sp. MB]VFK75664.1 MAG: hypothetical protein BECKMB1821H_GA0114242_102828 [Candidatus Kentron sp. MB]
MVTQESADGALSMDSGAFLLRHGTNSPFRAFFLALNIAIAAWNGAIKPSNTVLKALIASFLACNTVIKAWNIAIKARDIIFLV